MTTPPYDVDEVRNVLMDALGRPAPPTKDAAWLAAWLFRNTTSRSTVAWPPTSTTKPCTRPSACFSPGSY